MGLTPAVFYLGEGLVTRAGWDEASSAASCSLYLGAGGIGKNNILWRFGFVGLYQLK